MQACLYACAHVYLSMSLFLAGRQIEREREREKKRKRNKERATEKQKE